MVPADGRACHSSLRGAERLIFTNIMEMIWIRHAMTAGNLEKRYIGVTDEPLCEEGIALLKEEQPLTGVPDIVFTSPLLRCRQTAGLLFPGAEQIVIGELAEMNFGIFENRAFRGDLEYSGEYQSWLNSQCEDPVPDGESKEAFTLRCLEGFQKALGILKQRYGEDYLSADLTAAFVVHGGTIMSVFSRYALPQKRYYEWNPGNGHGYRGTWDGEHLHSRQTF